MMLCFICQSYFEIASIDIHKTTCDAKFGVPLELCHFITIIRDPFPLPYLVVFIINIINIFSTSDNLSQIKLFSKFYQSYIPF